ncbi:MAG: lactate racemase domain-containing protein [Caldisericota bacterium]|nr:lactate racemase domain-containing protein [Caldisericota bacterium]
MIEDIKVRKIKQNFDKTRIDNLSEYVHQSFKKSDLKDRIKSGDKIGITVGSRGITNIKLIVKEVVSELKNLNALPFILPAMGSHGGANSEGQKEVLASYGITQKEMGVPILPSMETIQIGKVENRIPIYFSKIAMEADGIIALNRVKMHTDFKSKIVESGMSKILAIGLGKARGASTIHSLGVYGLKNVIPQAAELIITKAPIIQGIGILENSYDQTMKISFVPPEDIIKVDSELLKISKEVMPMLPIDDLDVVIAQEIGKNISGTGFDTNVIGRLYINGEKEIIKPRIKRLIVFDITEESHGNALGIGLADITTRHLVNKINYKDMYANTITSTFLNRAKIPIIADSEKEAVEIAVKTCWKLKQSDVKLLIMKNTLDLKYLYVSKAAWEEIKDNGNIKTYGDWEKLSFDENGKMKTRL